MQKTIRSLFSTRPALLASRRGCMLLAFMLTFAAGNAPAAATSLSDTPVGSASNVPANLMLALSVEFPTGTVAAYGNAKGYAATNIYLGYFDPAKCYTYSTTLPPGTQTSGYFVPQGAVNTGGGCSITSGGTTTSYWSGNMLNWALMTALDEFRQALTGGTRIVDTTSSTVLIRSNLNSQSNTSNDPNRQIDATDNVAPATVIGDSTYSSATNVYLKVAGQGTQFIISNNSSFSNSGGGNNANTYNAEVQVCVTGMLESNCNYAHASTDYPNAHVYNKPDGLIQRNYTKIRVGAAGYIFKNGNGAANGAVRALLRDNGPTTYNGNGARLTNTNSEWDATTGIFASNPYPSDTTGTAPGGVNATQSGAINYLNLFGYANGYETYDTLADLYWSSLAYLMQVPLDASYTTGLSTGNSLDTGFPVLTGTALNDPVQYTCQSNAIVTIGDSHTWYDTRVPSSGGPAPFSATQAALAVVNGADAANYTNLLGNLPLIEASGATPASITMAQLRQFGSGATTASVVTQLLGGQIEPNTTGTPTYNMAGLAYFAHTNDIRSDKTGKQTVDTYTVDVLEPGAYDGSSNKEIYNPSKFSTGGGAAGPNMYWLAAKYGGFNDINGDGVPANFLTWHTNPTTAAGKNLRPDNYFPGNRPDLIQTGLSKIFKKVSETPQSAAGPGVSLTRVLINVGTGLPYYSPKSGFPIYTVKYVPGAWTGDVTGYVASALPAGTVNPVAGGTTWAAQANLDALVAANSKNGWDTGRRIITSDGSGTGIAFRYASLSAAESGILSSNQLNFLRGDQSNEGTAFHVRSHILGDIVHSEAVLVQNALAPLYTDTNNPGYSLFSTAQANRQPVVYVGGNDGMLHAFQADFQAPTVPNPVTGGGSELFAYVPSLLFNGPNSTPAVDGLAALSNLTGVSTNDYAHHFYVDQTPQVADVDFKYTAAATYVSPPVVSTTPTTNCDGIGNDACWHTMLVGGLGKGGKGIYALDVTTVPAAIDATTNTAAMELTLATSKVLWEFSGTHMGYSYGKPLIVKTRKYGWVVLMTSGYNNDDGHGYLYVLNAKTGKLLETLTTSASDSGTASNPSGLAQATAFTKDVSDNTVEQVYAGDLLGHVWRFDLSSGSTAAYPAPILFATLTDGTNPQPITTAPRVELDLNATALGTRRWVFVGTGQALDVSDFSTTQQQTMYALRDGDANAPSTTSLPITRSTATLKVLTDLTVGVSLVDTDAGWYYDLTGTAGVGGATERIVIDPDAAAGTNTIAWGTLTPTSDPCALSGNIYAASFATGQSVLLDSSNNIMAKQTATTAPTKLEEVQLPGSPGEIVLMYGQAGLPPQTLKQRHGSPGGTPLRVNWREILN
ncbi:MAG: PilC/PilY family type IV pilus protein [Rhodanobacter sp.]